MPNGIDSFVGFALAAAAVLVAGSRGITFLVDRVRDAVPFGSTAGMGLLWGGLALVLALIACIGFGINPIGELVASMPQGTDKLTGTAGEVLSAIAFAGLSSSWHDRDKAKNPPAA
jgi:hypothetical protein